MIFFHTLAVLKTISKLSRKLRKEKEYFPVIKLLNRNWDKLQKVELWWDGSFWKYSRGWKTLIHFCLSSIELFPLLFFPQNVWFIHLVFSLNGVKCHDCFHFLVNFPFCLTKQSRYLEIWINKGLSQWVAYSVLHYHSLSHLAD